MAYEWLEEFCMALPGTTKRWQAEWFATLYEVGGKMFLMDGGDKEEKPIITVKLEPLRGDALRREWPGKVIPGHYMNKVHWNSVYRDSGVPDDEMKSMVAESHRLVLQSLTKKMQKEILGE